MEKMSWNILEVNFQEHLGEFKSTLGNILSLQGTIDESTMWSFWHSMATNWSIMAARTQIEQIKLEEFNLKGMKSMED